MYVYLHYVNTPLHTYLSGYQRKARKRSTVVIVVEIHMPIYIYIYIYMYIYIYRERERHTCNVIYEDMFFRHMGWRFEQSPKMDFL